MAPASITLLKTLLTSALFFLLFTNVPTCNAQSYGKSVLYSTETLKAGTKLIEGPYSFVMQGNCNLVLYKHHEAIWSSNTAGIATNCYLKMQSDRNLVVYTPQGKDIWASKTWKRGEDNYVLILQKDGNVAIYDARVWNTGINSHILNRDDEVTPAISWPEIS